jgi:hypothetical protein
MAGKGGIRSTSFKPGQSGNPGGRPKGFAEVAELARSHAPAAITALVDIVSSAESPPAARVGAANALLDRGFGKPSSAVAIGGDPDGEPIKVQDLTPEDRAEAFTRAFRKLPDAAKPALLALLKDKAKAETELGRKIVSFRFSLRPEIRAIVRPEVLMAVFRNVLMTHDDTTTGWFEDKSI